MGTPTCILPASSPLWPVMGNDRPVTTAVCPGSYDPVTNGHLDVFARAAATFERVIVAVLVNQSKRSLFTVAERAAMVAQVCRPYPNVEVDTFEGLLVDYCRTRGVRTIVKGLRAVTDFDYELQMAQMNSRLAEVETFFVATSPQFSFLSSSIVKEAATLGADVSGLVPDSVLTHLHARVRGG